MKRTHNMGFRQRVVKVDLRHSLMPDRRWPEIRLQSSMTVSELKNKLYANTGTHPSDMTLYAYAPYNVQQTQVLLDNDSANLDTYGIEDGHIIYIRAATSSRSDTTYPVGSSRMNFSNSRLQKHYQEQLQRCQELGDDEAFEKYKMSDDDYALRAQDLRNFISQMRTRAGLKVADDPSSKNAKTIAELKEEYTIGTRCSVSPGEIRGSVQFVGIVNNKTLIGVELDEPLGNSDGTINGTRVFNARGGKYAGFYPPEQVEVGDFPEVDPFDIT
ncbi:CAP-Gly domain family protein [Babesia bovis T2Bo]|nr:CAP-Gly domain family protein [Babesia bovis T2Bo]EDO06922.2 CAP-Gly domain family protein [Babesia bovis T2Bo]